MQPRQKDKRGQRPTKAALPTQKSESAWQGWSNKVKAPRWVSIIYKEFLKAANENLDDFVAVAVLATLAAVTHGEGHARSIIEGENVCGPGGTKY